jgi:hypothetical protein
MERRIRLVRGRIGSRRMRRAVGCATVGALSTVLFAGCSAGASVESPSPSTTEPFTHAQVLGWVAPTLGNGIAFVSSVSPRTSSGQLAADSRPLSAATAVALHELAQIPWEGDLQPPEEKLAAALVRIEERTAANPGPGYVGQLDTDVRGAEGALRSLRQAVKG